MLIHLTQFESNFQQFITEEESADLFMQKPLSQKDLIALLRLLKLKWGSYPVRLAHITQQQELFLN